jgi:hypothetical protein
LPAGHELAQADLDAAAGWLRHRLPTRRPAGHIPDRNERATKRQQPSAAKLAMIGRV